MNRLELLLKVYLYGETLSSEEVNLLVQYINNTINAINALIDKNNGINTGHCEIRYKNSAQLPVAPASGTSGMTNGWSSVYTYPDTANGQITWMTICFVNGNSEYGDWSTPVCVTWGSVVGLRGPLGETGLSGAFVSRVFKRSNTAPSRPVGGTYRNPVPEGWSDSVPTNSKAIIWSSTSTFYGNDTHTDWSDPAPESDSLTLDIEFSPNNTQPSAPTGNIPFSNHESEGWYDPSSSNFNNAGTMIWRAERKVSNGEYNGDWVITRIYGEQGPSGTGGTYEFRYANSKSAPTKPADNTDGITNVWKRNQIELTEEAFLEGYKTWMTQCLKNSNGLYGVWSDPIRITGGNGKDGEDGTDIEFIYTRNNTGIAPDAPTTVMDATISQDDWPNIDGNTPTKSLTYGGQTVTWSDNPRGVEQNIKYEYVSTRTKNNGIWSEYSTPVVWSKWGEKGMDGDGYEYIYKRFNSLLSWGSGLGNPANWPIVLTREYYGPSGYEWSDDPVGVDSSHKFEYVSTRKSRNGVWQAFCSPTLWANYSEATSTGPGQAGHIGPMSYLAGVWNGSTVYTRTEDVNPIVYYPATDGYYYLTEVGSSDIGIPPNLSSKWTEAENFNTVFTDILFVNLFAKLGSFIINEDWMLSRYGILYDTSGNSYIIDGAHSPTINGLSYTYNNAYLHFDPSFPNSSKPNSFNFCPYFAVDALTGESYFLKTHIKGEVEADLFRAGTKNGLNITVANDSINFNNGNITKAWFTTKKYNSNGTVDSTSSNGFYLYMVSPENGHLITIDFANLLFVDLSQSLILQIPVYTDNTTVKYITIGTNGLANISNYSVYYTNTDDQGNSTTTLYYRSSDRTGQITGVLGTGYYVLILSGCYCVTSESYGGYPYALREVRIYLKAKYDSTEEEIIGYGDKLYLIKKDGVYWALNTSTNLQSAVTNSLVCIDGDSTKPLTSNSSLFIAPNNGTVNFYTASYYQTANSYPSYSNANAFVSIFTPGSVPMSKHDYSN